jgi:hypothetical protein
VNLTPDALNSCVATPAMRFSECHTKWLKWVGDGTFYLVKLAGSGAGADDERMQGMK